MKNEKNVICPSSWQFASIRWELRKDNKENWYPFEARLVDGHWQWQCLRPHNPFKTLGYASRYITKQIAKLAILATFMFITAACPTGEGSENDCPGNCCIEINTLRQLLSNP